MNEFQNQFPYNKFTIDEVDNYEEKFFDLVDADGNDEVMKVTKIKPFMKSCGMKFKDDLVL